LIIPPNQLSAEALQSVIEDWLSRQAQENAADVEQFSDMIESVRQQLVAEKLLLTWDDPTQTINVIHPDDLPRDF